MTVEHYPTQRYTDFRSGLVGTGVIFFIRSWQQTSDNLMESLLYPVFPSLTMIISACYLYIISSVVALVHEGPLDTDHSIYRLSHHSSCNIRNLLSGLSHLLGLHVFVLN